MNRIKSILPELAVGLILFIMTAGFFWGTENYEYRIVHSDGRGYYAFLPAVLIQKDLTFKSTHKAEISSYDQSIDPHYLVVNKKGQSFNKCYPGVATMQLPFFLMATLYESGESNITGYSTAFLKFFHLGALFFGVLGFFFLRRYLGLVLDDKRLALVTAILLFFGTAIFYQTVFRPSMSHHYSFCLFAAFAYLIHRYFKEFKLKQVLLIGALLGLIVMVRPLNIVIIFAIPFLLGSWNNVRLFFGKLLILKNGHLAGSFVLFLIAISPIFILNYGETGDWMNWSYEGEGFNFGFTHFLDVLFSFRIGVFIHIPLLILSLVGLFFLFKTQKQAVIFWFGYLFVITFLISSWWSWDFGGFYGNRVYIEHMVFFAVPLAYFIKSIRWKWLGVSLASICMLFMWMRAYQLVEHIIPNRLTATTYFKSILVLGEEHSADFMFNRDCEPFGNFTRSIPTKPKGDLPMRFDENREFGREVTFEFPADAKLNRYLFQLEITKKLDPEEDYKNVFVVFDAYDTTSNHREYQARPMYEYIKEGGTDSYEQVIEQEYFINPRTNLNLINVYIWNPGHKKFTIEDYELSVREYEPFEK
ncbi:MAG: hypothetical protein ACI865_000921 [Flavobacteriaceae bacterium]